MGEMKEELDKVIESLESVITLHESIIDFFRIFKEFSDTMIHVRAELIKKDYEKLKKFRFDSKVTNGDKLSMVLPIQLGKEEIERVLNGQEDALIYN